MAFFILFVSLCFLWLPAVQKNMIEILEKMKF